MHDPGRLRSEEREHVAIGSIQSFAEHAEDLELRPAGSASGAGD